MRNTICSAAGGAGAIVRPLLPPAMLLALFTGAAAAQEAPRADSGILTVQRIFGSAEFRPRPFGPARWLPGGTAYTTVERSGGGGDEIVRYDAASGEREVVVSARQLTPAGDTVPLAIENYVWSQDLTKVLIFTNGRPVWRTESRGDFWVLDRANGSLRRLGGPRERPSTLMFAKFSPDGRRVGYVREFNLYVEDLATGRITPLTRDGSRTIINGTFDWVYEEELMDYWADGWRWSPDGRFIAYWQLDASGVRDFDLFNDTDSLYSFVTPVQYPKAGSTNSAARIGVVSAAGGPTRWMRVPGEPRQNYLARLEWAPGGGSLLIQQLNRLQNRLTLYAADPRTGVCRTVVEEVSEHGWVDPDTSGPPAFLSGGRMAWMSERSGWRHWYALSPESGALSPITRGSFDVVSRVAVDTAAGWFYYVASPDNAAQQYLFRTRLDGAGRSERVSPPDQPGWHTYIVSPGARYAIHSYSRFGVPPVVDLVSLPEHRVVRPLVDNAALRQRVAALRRGENEWFQLDLDSGTRVMGWMIKPPDFSASRRYPLVMFEYGGPLPDIQGGTVVDRWAPLGSGGSYLWFTMLAQQGYIVASVEHRGTGAHGRAWREATYGQLGVVESADLARAARALGRRPFIDSTRIAVYGHSYGGFMALNAILRYPDVFSTAIAAAPVTNWRFYDTIYTERYLGLPQDNAAGYERGSPLGLAANLRGNLLIVHGTGDDNVHVQNTEAMINALVRAGRQFTVMLYPGRNHGIASDGAAPHRFELYMRFLNEHMRAGEN